MKQIFPNIAPILPPKGQITPGYSMMVWKWSFPKTRMNESILYNGLWIKKLLTLDLNIPEEEFAAIVNAAPAGSTEAKQLFVQNYPCIHGCKGCFNNGKLRNRILNLPEIMRVVDEGKPLGLESMKFLGPGELLMNPKLFWILDELASRDIVAGIFTKAALMGNDVLARHYHGISSEELTRRLVSYPNTTFLVGGRSFDPDFENRFIPQNKREFAEKFNYHEARNLAMERLAAAGMNNDLMKQRMVVACAPVTEENIECAFEMYQWGAERNIPVYLPPTMDSGKGHKYEEAAKDKKFEDDYIELGVQVYTWAIERGIMTLEQLRDEGASSYLGLAPCNQLTHGLYLHYDGQVMMCPGNDLPEFIVHDDVRKASLFDIWTNSKNYQETRYNNQCVKDGYSIPMRFYDEVPAKVAERLGVTVP